MLISYKRGQTGIILRVKIRNSSVATGAGLTGLTNAASGLKISTIADNEAAATVYAVGSSNVETITTLGTYSAPTSGKCRFKEVDATNHPGVYEIHIADARFAVSNSKSLLVSISGATNAAECDAIIPLTQLDPYDAVRAGLTALPNANAEAAGGLYTRGTGAGQISQQSNGQVDVNVSTIKSQAVTCSAGVTVGAFVGNATAALAVDASGRVDVGKVVGTITAAQYLSALGGSTIIPAGTGSTTTSIKLAPYGALTTSIVGFGLMRADTADLAVSQITAYNPATFTATVSPPLPVAPVANDVLILLPTAPVLGRVDVGKWAGETALTDTENLTPKVSVVAAYDSLNNGWSTFRFSPSRGNLMVCLDESHDNTADEYWPSFSVDPGLIQCIVAGTFPDVISAGSIAANAITNAKIADGAITSAKFSVSTITGVASGILEKIDQLWRLFFKKSNLDLNAAQLKTYADDGTTVLTTQTVTPSGTSQTRGAAT